MEKEILIAGGSGLIGANLMFKLKEHGLPFVASRNKNSTEIFQEHCVRYDFLDFDQCLQATKNKSAVILCAAVSYGAKRNKENPTGSILPNLQIAAGLLEASARNNVGSVLVISSTTVYQAAFFPIREDLLDLNVPPFDAYFGVGWYNRYLEQLASLYHKIYGMQVIIFRPTNIYGPYDKFDVEHSHVVPALIKRALDREDPFEVWGSPQVVRDFLYVEDFVDDIFYSLIHDDIPSNTPINVCSGSPQSIEYTVEVILKVCNHDPRVSFNLDKPSTIPYRAVDDALYCCLFKKRNRTPFEIGVRKTVNWYQRQAAKV